MKNPSPMVSVIIPAYNAASYIGQAIESVLSQTYLYKEVIVVDDGSTDGTRAAIGSWIDRREIVYLYQKNAGPSAARNLGIKKSHGELVAFLDADDIYLPDKLAKQAAFLSDHPECGVCYCDIWHFYDTAPEKLFMNRRSYYAGDNVFEELLVMNFMNPLMIMLRRSAISQAGMFDESYPRSEDWEYWIRLAYRGIRIGHLKGEPLAKYRIHEKGISYGVAIKIVEKKTMLRIFTALKEKMSTDERKRYHIDRVIFRQKTKLWGAYFLTYFLPLQWYYQWIQKKRLVSA